MTYRVANQARSLVNVKLFDEVSAIDSAVLTAGADHIGHLIGRLALLISCNTCRSLEVSGSVDKSIFAGTGDHS